MLWARPRGRPQGIKFRRQHPIGPYVVDFYCRTAALAIEVDGEGHSRGQQPERDIERDTFLHENGHRVLRIAAARVLADPDATADAIVMLAANPLHQPAAGPPPRAGEDQE